MNAVADVVDAGGPDEQVSVIPGQARQGLGRVLLDHDCEWALSNGLKAVSSHDVRECPLEYSVLRTLRVPSNASRLTSRRAC
jgi:hypothetical protein